MAVNLETFTEGDLSDVAICRRVGETLQKHFPNYPWMVGLHDASTGVLVIDLPETWKPPSLRRWAYLFHIKDVGDDRKIRDAGGEWLERIRLRREAAREWAQQEALANGIDLTNAILRSK